MNILALDLGTQMGYAIQKSDGDISGGSVSFHTKTNENAAQRWLKFLAWLRETKSAMGTVDAIYFEQVMRHVSTYSAHVYGGFHALLHTWCEHNSIICRPVGVTQIKRYWTGKGNAKKADMIAKALEKGFEPMDDNHADAIAILSFALSEFKK